MNSETPQEYSVDEEILYFFRKTSATKSSCDAYAQELVGGPVVPVTVQGVCSYTVYAGPNHGFVVQFRLQSLGLNTKMATLARDIYGSLVPTATFHGQIGEEGVDGKEPLSVYVMSRVKGISHLDFILAHNFLEDSLEYCTWRENLVSDIAGFLGLAWKNPQDANPSDREAMFRRYEKDLRQLLAALPSRFLPVIQQSIDSLPAIFSLPMVLVHKDFGVNNVMVDADDNHLVGVIDWAEAEIGPFGTNLHSLQQFMSKYRLRVGWIRHANYETLDGIFWDALSTSAGGLDPKTIQTIKAARIVGLLRSRGFTSRLANKPEPEPIRDDESGAYEMLGLDGLLINPATKLVD
ncbi:hypothetical protein N7519_010093 [Penicillium mononematosum]|uniref:uncharacterized protein n=1 Tax=Penicillium mononematosum TaxID=268346 RepID=UPI0025489DA5|nr:uncharacterized protein N7519_010093 [Penicillium mononematosum]KAJ6179632.1 hypothetical protein N7519_010093 [Penicillium mononematosum]